MLVKVLKYDMRAVWRIWWIMTLGVLGVSLVGAVGLRTVITLIEADKFALLIFLGILLVVGSVLAIVASAIVTEILIYVRFYKNFFTDEGYLTFTLPVRRGTLLFSKTLNALIWTMAEMLLIVVCICLLIFLGIPSDVSEELVRGFSMSGSMIHAQIGFWIVPCVLAIVFFVILSALFSINLIQLCITVGSVLAKKAKILAAVGIYYAINMTFSFGSQILSLIFTLLMGTGMTVIIEQAAPMMQGALVTLVLLIVCCMMAALAAVMYFITQTILERKLNLA